MRLYTPYETAYEEVHGGRYGVQGLSGRQRLDSKRKQRRMKRRGFSGTAYHTAFTVFCDRWSNG